jgi:hypothetical protein
MMHNFVAKYFKTIDEFTQWLKTKYIENYFLTLLMVGDSLDQCQH